LAKSDLFGDLPPGDDEQLIQQIIRDCRRGADQQSANSSVARAIVDWRNANAVRGHVVKPEPLRMSVDTLTYCADVAAIYQERAWVLNLDCRAKMSLSADGKEFMKSLIHHTARVGDLRDAGVAILRTPKIGEGRRAIFEVLAGEPRYSMEQILKMVTETYSLWEALLRARHAGGKASEV
jgi:hypothetical protein